jgi:hypothetical protein
MSLLTRVQPEVLPEVVSIENIDPSRQAIAERVIGTAERLDLDPAQAVLVGSAALLMYGVQLPENYGAQRPSDVDLSVSTALYNQLAEAEATPSGLPVVDGNNRNLPSNIFTIPAGNSDALPVDVINRFKPRGMVTVAEYDKRFAEKPYNVIDGTNLRIATLGQIYRELRHNKSVNNGYDIDNKPTADFWAFKQAMQARGISPWSLRKQR